MTLFQKSVVNKYLSTIDTATVRNAFNNFLKSYSDTERLDNIRSAKEEQRTSESQSSAEEYDLMQLFDRQKAEAQAIKAIIDQTDREIDLMVYKLYELTEEEIRIAEGKL